MRRIGILTGGGDAPGLNAVIRGLVLTAVRELSLEVVGIRDGFGGFVEAEGTLDLDEHAVRGLLWRGGSILGCNNRYHGDVQVFVDRMRELAIEGLVVAGGEGSLFIASEMQKRGAAVVGVPKTIDNDVRGTDVSFGFDTAVGVVADAVNRLITTAESHHRIMIVEVMGRHSGFIALMGAIAGSADIALIPEIPYDPGKIVEVIKKRTRKGRTYTVIVVAEGAKRVGGHVILDEDRTRATGREHLGGIHSFLAAELRDLLDYEIRALSLGHLQRGGMPTPFDRVLGTRMGVESARALARGESGVFTALRGGKIVLAPLSEAAKGARKVQRNSQLVSTARAIGMSFGD